LILYLAVNIVVKYQKFLQKYRIPVSITFKYVGIVRYSYLQILREIVLISQNIFNSLKIHFRYSMNHDETND
jgi:hypothetical protein